MNMVNSRYAWSRLAFACLDKVANLVKGLKGIKGRNIEADYFYKLCSYDFKEILKRNIKHFMEEENEQLSKIMLRSIDKTYDATYRCLEKIYRSSDYSELNRYLRIFRNTTHGSFLDGNKFEDGFFTASPYVPYEFKHIPFFIAWALAVDVDEFIQSF